MQQVSCEIKLSHWKEGLLDCIQYFTLAFATLLSGLLGKRSVMKIYHSIDSSQNCLQIWQCDTYLLLLE